MSAEEFSALEEARATIRELNRRAQEAERRMRAAEGRLRGVEGAAAWLREQKEGGRRWLKERGVRYRSQDEVAAVGGLLAEAERLEKENEVLRRAFRDFVQDAEVVRAAVDIERERCAAMLEGIAKDEATPAMIRPLASWLRPEDAALGLARDLLRVAALRVRLEPGAETASTEAPPPP